MARQRIFRTRSVDALVQFLVPPAATRSVSGFEKVRSGKNIYYVHGATGERISRRQYLNRVRGVTPERYAKGQRRPPAHGAVYVTARGKIRTSTDPGERGTVNTRTVVSTTRVESLDEFEIRAALDDTFESIDWIEVYS